VRFRLGPGRRIGDSHLLHRFRLLNVEPHLPKRGSFFRIHPGAQMGFLEEITPPCLAVILTLIGEEILQTSFCGFNSLYDGYNPARLVGPLIKPNDRK